MAEFIGWDDDEKKERPVGSKPKTNQFLKLEPGAPGAAPVTYRIRLVSKPLKFWQHWEPVACRAPSPVKGPDGQAMVVDPLMLMGHEPKKRYTVWVLDRGDNNALKMMDFSQGLYDAFLQWSKDFNDDPGGPNGPDWKIDVEIPAGKTKRNMTYKARAVDRTPFTDEEKKRLEDGDLYNRLKEIRKENTPDEIRALLAAKESGAPPPAKRASAPSRVPPKKAAAAPPAEDFDSSTGGDEGDAAIPF